MSEPGMLEWLRDGNETVTRAWHDVWYDALASLVEFLRSEVGMASIYDRASWRLRAELAEPGGRPR